MFYKIINQDSEVFKKLKALRKKEILIDKKNIQLIEEKAGQKWDNFLGYQPQSGFSRTTRYIGFEFKNPELLNDKIWTKNKDYPTIYEPYKRTKAGREMQSFINNLEGSFYKVVYDILGLESLRRFITPYVEIKKDDTIILRLDDQHEPKDKNLIEITSVEFNELFKLD